jgi:hypothetical protein
VWDVGSTYPSGHCCQVMGPIDDRKVVDPSLAKIEKPSGIDNGGLGVPAC